MNQEHRWVKKKLLNGKEITVCSRCGILYRFENKDWPCTKP